MEKTLRAANDIKIFKTPCQMKTIKPTKLIEDAHYTRKAMTNCDLLYFSAAGTEIAEDVFNIAIKEQNILFARWCFIRGYEFKDVEPDVCTPEFALFMMEITQRTDNRRTKFLKRVLMDEEISGHLKYNSDLDLYTFKNEAIAIAMKKGKKEIFEEEEDSEIIKLGILLGHKYPLETIMNICWRTNDEALKKYMFGSTNDSITWHAVKINNKRKRN